MAKIRGLLFFIALALLFFIGGLVNAVKVKAQDPAPAYKIRLGGFANSEASLTLKSVNDKIQDAYSVKQENKKFSNSENLKVTNSFIPAYTTEQFKNKDNSIVMINRRDYLGVSNEQKSTKKNKYYNKSFPITNKDARRYTGLGIHTAKVIRD